MTTREADAVQPAELPPSRAKGVVGRTPGSGAEVDDELVPALVAALREQISRGEIPVGTWLRQERVAAAFGVSRTPVREALRLLQAHGLVENLANRGMRVAMPSTTDLREAMDVGAVLEGHAAARAAARATQAHLAALEEALGLFDSAVEAVRTGRDSDDLRTLWHRANGTFHATLLAAAGNAQLTRSIEALYERVPRNVTWTALSRRPELVERNVAEHRSIYRAVWDRDEAAAFSLARAHVEHALQLVDTDTTVVAGTPARR